MNFFSHEYHVDSIPDMDKIQIPPNLSLEEQIHFLEYQCNYMIHTINRLGNIIYNMERDMECMMNYCNDSVSHAEYILNEHINRTTRTGFIISNESDNNSP